MSDLESMLAAGFRVLEDEFHRINTDGVEISFSELDRALSDIGFSKTQELRSIFERVDRHRTGNLTFPEFLSLFYYFTEVAPYTSVLPRQHAGTVDRAFKFLENAYIKYDVDGSRTLSREELALFMEENWSERSPKGFDALCDAVFPRRSDKLSFKRFLVLLYSMTIPDGRFAVKPNGSTSGSSATATGSSSSLAASGIQSTELYKLLKHAFKVLEQDFQRFDTDNDNSISLAELSQALTQTNGGRLVAIVGKLEHLWARIDLNGDNVVDFVEFMYLVYLLVENMAYKDICPNATDASAVKRAFLFLRKSYSRYDEDRNQRLDREEVSNFLLEYFGEVPSAFDGIFNRIRNPQKGHIDFVRFLHLLYEIVAHDGHYVAKLNAPQSNSSASVAAAAAAEFKTPAVKAVERVPRMDNLTLSEVTKGPEIGSGGYSTVYRCDLRGHTCAVKILKGAITDEVRHEFDLEVNFMRMLDHKHLLSLVGAVAEKDTLCIVTPFCEQGSLFDLLHKKRKRLCQRDVLRLALEIAEAVNHLHNLKPQAIIHRDLKSLNVLLDAAFSVKVADFGLSKTIHAGTYEQHSLGVGTPQWTAPEVLQSRTYDLSADVYSFGCLLFELTHNSIPFAGMDVVQVSLAAVRGKRPTIKRSCPQPLADLMQKCWQHDPMHRPSFAEIIDILQPLQLN